MGTRALPHPIRITHHPPPPLPRARSKLLGAVNEPGQNAPSSSSHSSRDPPPPIRSVRVRATRTHTNHFDPPLAAPQGRAITGDRARVDLTLRGSELRPRTVLGQSIGASSFGEAPRESAERAIPVWAARALRLKGPLGLPFGWFELLYLDEVQRVTVCRAGEMAC